LPDGICHLVPIHSAQAAEAAWADALQQSLSDTHGAIIDEHPGHA
jgi:hypothetical protein